MKKRRPGSHLLRKQKLHVWFSGNQLFNRGIKHKIHFNSCLTNLQVNLLHTVFALIIALPRINSAQFRTQIKIRHRPLISMSLISTASSNEALIGNLIVT